MFSADRMFLKRQRLVAQMALGKWDDAWSTLREVAPEFRRPADCTTLFSFLVETIGRPVPFSARRHIADSVAQALPEVLTRTGINKCGVMLARGLTPDSASLRRPEVVNRLLAQANDLLATPAGRNDGIILSLSQALATIDSASLIVLRRTARFVELENETTLPLLVDADSVMVSGDSVQVSWRWRTDTDFRWDLPYRWAPWSLGTVVSIGSGPSIVRLTFQVSRGTPNDSLVEKRGRFAALATEASFIGVTSTGAIPSLGPTAARTREWRGTVRVDGDRLVLVVRGPIAEVVRSAMPSVAEFGTARCYGVSGGLCDRPRRPIVYR